MAAAQNNQASKESLEKVIEMMTPAQIAEGQKRAEILWDIVENHQKQ
ncbi:MAG: hypothetical protein PVI90_14755 [Desulfobacteraceae bacterium]|jgi:hypothetical protein